MFEKILLIFMSCFAVLQASANEVHNSITKLDVAARREMFTKMLRQPNLECDRILLDYFQGFYNKIAYWSVICVNNREWSIRLPEKNGEQIGIRTCDSFDLPGLTCLDPIPEDYSFVAKKNEDMDDCSREAHKSSGSKKFVVDRCGIIRVDLTSDFIDDTMEYLDSVRSYSSGSDAGIISLLRVKTKSGSPSCKLRQLRYLPTEAGYHYTLQDLAEDTANFYASEIKKDHTQDFLDRNMSIPFVLSEPPDKFKSVSSGPVKIKTYSAWETVYDLWSSQENELISTAYRHYVLVIKVPGKLRHSNNSYYIAAECDYSNRKSNLSSGDNRVNQIFENVTILK